MSGSIVKSGSGVGPSGDPAPTAPVGLSQNTGNLLTTGSDNLLYLPPSQIDPEIWSVRLRSFNSVGNPNFEVDQRLCGATGGWTGPTSIDRWMPAKSGTMAGSWQQIVGPVLLPGTNFTISSKFFRALLATQETTLAAGDLLYLVQFIEGPLWRELMSDVHSVSLVVRSSVAGLAFSLYLKDPATSTKSLTKLCTIPNANTWTLISLPNLPVWPSGNFVNSPGSNGYQIGICLACGTTNTSPANDTWQNGNFVGAVGQSNFAASAVNSTFDIAFVQHEPGPLCTTLQDKPFAQNYDECLRYYQKSWAYATAVGAAVPASVISGAIPRTPLTFVPGTILAKPMAKNPTLTIYNGSTGASGSVWNGSAATSPAVSSSSVGEKGIVSITLSTGQTAGDVIQYHYTADTGW